MSKKNLFLKELIKSTSKGFSLVEILVALTLIGLGGTFVVGKIFDQLHEGNVKAAKIQMGQFAQRLQEYRRKCNSYPTTEQGLDALVSKPTEGRECRRYPADGFIQGGILQKDPWDEDYIYESDGRTFNIYSYGSDNQEGGEEKDADIYFREPKTQGDEDEK